MELKTCTKCGVPKPLDEFTADRSKRDGKRPGCKACHREARQAVAGSTNEKRRQRYLTNVEQERAQAREYARAHVDEQRIRSRSYRAQNRERLYEATNQWRKANPEKVRASNQRRRAQKRDATVEPFSFRDMLNDWEEHDLWGCFYCGDDVSQGYEVDHFVPLANGGPHALENLVPACKPCNGSKGAGDPWRFLRSALEARGGCHPAASDA